MLRIDVAKLLEKEMDRKEFLKHVGMAVIGVTGVSAIIASLLNQPTTTRVQGRRGLGYGDSAYGGQAR